LAGDGEFTRRCNAWLENRVGCDQALLTHSCTAALEITAILADLQPGDEVIMPSYTFVSTANAFVLHGAMPVFVDIRRDTLNIDEARVEEAITEKTRAIVVVHYAGVACEMDTIMAIADRHKLLVIEDDAQGIGSSYKGRPLGSIGHLAAVSFHETKNIISGEGGALLVNSPRFSERAEMIREKVMRRTHEELPYGVAVQVESFTEKPDQNLVVIQAVINVERDSHKKIIVGRQGQMVRTLGQDARREIEKFLGTRVYLELFVRVQKDWTQSDRLLRELGYE
jgi:dTDP-4-amino-4,6-dideoxygalactose transaminase